MSCEAAALFGFGVYFDISCLGGHGVLRDSVGVVGGCSLSKRMFSENSSTSASRASNTSDFLLSPLCGIHAPERLCPFSSHLRHASSAYRGSAMTFEEILDQAIAMLQRRGRLTYSTLKRQFQLDDAALEDLKNEVASRANAWRSMKRATSSSGQVARSPLPTRQSPHPHRLPMRPNAASSRCCSATWWARLPSSGQLDPEDLREVVRAYQAACAEVIQRFDGYIAQYLGRWPAGLLWLSAGPRGRCSACRPGWPRDCRCHGDVEYPLERRKAYA